MHRALAGVAGLQHGPLADRMWMIVDHERRFLTQREEPSMACVVPSLCVGSLRLTAPQTEPLELDVDSSAYPRVQVKLWGSELAALDCGDQAAAWISRVLRRESRIVRYDESQRRQSSREYTVGLTALNRFSDGFPYLVLGQASLADLDNRLAAAGRECLAMDRFRSNIVIEGLGAHEEDFVHRWTSGALALRPVKPCPRCAIPSVNQQTGVPGSDPRDILGGYRLDARHGIVLGQNALIEAGAGLEISVGQTLDVEWNF